MYCFEFCMANQLLVCFLQLHTLACSFLFLNSTLPQVLQVLLALQSQLHSYRLGTILLPTFSPRKQARVTISGLILREVFFKERDRKKAGRRKKMLQLCRSHTLNSVSCWTPISLISNCQGVGFWKSFIICDGTEWTFIPGLCWWVKLLWTEDQLLSTTAWTCKTDRDRHKHRLEKE